MSRHDSRGDGVRMLVGAGLGLLLAVAVEGVPVDMGLVLGSAVGMAFGAGRCRRRGRVVGFLVKP
jgi:hypothetical protein